MPTISTTDPLPTAVSDLIDAGVRQAAVNWRVDLPDDISFNFKLGEARLTGNRQLEPGSKLAYYNIIQQLWRFCAWVGDYDSMLIMLYPKIKKFPAVNKYTLDLFLRFKCLPKGESLDNLMAVNVDVLGNTFSAVGSWRCPKRIGQCASAISTLHTIHDMHRHAYHDICDECIEEQQNGGCAMHSPHMRVFRKGNPINNEDISNTLKEMKNPNYVYKGASQLLPRQIRMIRTYLLLTPSLQNLMIWTIINLGICLFLRGDEVITIRADNFHPELFVKDGRRVVGLLVSVFGKTDKKNVPCFI